MEKGILKEYATTLDALSRLVDPLLVLLTTYALFALNLFYPADLARMMAIYTIPLVFVIFPFFKIYRSWRFSSLITEAGTVLLAWFSVILSFNLLMLVLASPEQRKILLPYILFGYPPFITWAGTVAIVLVSVRMALRSLLRFARSKGYNIRNVLMVGVGQHGERLVNFFQRRSWMGIRVNGFLDGRQKDGDTVNGVPVLGPIEDLTKHIEGIDLVFIDLPMREEEKIRAIMRDLANFTAAVYFLPDIFTYDFVINTSFSDIGGIPTIALRASPFSGMNKLIKRLEDIVCGSVILVLFSPVIALIALGIKLSSPGPVIFRQKRCGMNGEEILVYKFRTMNTVDENPVFKDVTLGDPRVTRFGAFLRKTSLDELPQLFNVLGGSMSLVGPRPHPLKFNEAYKKLVPGYMLRHQIKPGLTGFAQISGFRGETDTLEKLEKRIEYDLKYINSWSLLLDLKIIFLTSLRFFRQPTAY